MIREGALRESNSYDMSYDNQTKLNEKLMKYLENRTVMTMF